MPSDPATATADPGLWAAGRIELRAAEAVASPVRVARPYALVGRTEGADLRLADRAVSARHVYLHLDRRGVFAVDLATRSGTRFEGIAAPATWLAPGQSFEVAGRAVTLADARLDDRPRLGPTPAYHLTDATDAPLVRVSLHPLAAPQAPWTLNSELVFLGRSPACGVPIRGASAARVHAVLVRTEAAAFVVNLAGWGVWVDDRAVRGAARLAPGSTLTAGTTRFEVRLDPTEARPRRFGPAPAPGPRLLARPGAAPEPEPVPADAFESDPDLELVAEAEAAPPAEPLPVLPEPEPAPTPVVLEAWAGALVPGIPPPPAELLRAGDAQAALVSWMLGAVQAMQGELLRRQDDFHRELVRAVRALHEDNQETLEVHQTRVEALHRELAELREEIRQRFGPANAPPPADTPALPKPPPLRVAPSKPAPVDPAAATAWLLNRVNRLDEEARSTWRDLLGRLGPKS